MLTRVLVVYTDGCTCLRTMIKYQRVSTKLLTTARVEFTVMNRIYRTQFRHTNPSLALRETICDQSSERGRVANTNCRTMQ